MTKKIGATSKSKYKNLRRLDPSLKNALYMDGTTNLTVRDQMENLVLIPMRLSNTDFSSTMATISKNIYVRAIGFIHKILNNAKEKKISALDSNQELVRQANPNSPLANPNSDRMTIEDEDAQVTLISSYETIGRSLLENFSIKQCYQIFSSQK